MDLTKIVSELRAELDTINSAIAVLERLAQTTRKRRGRPPLYMLSSNVKAEAGAGRRRFSEETKKKMAAAQKKRWAAFRKNQKKAPEE